MTGKLRWAIVLFRCRQKSVIFHHEGLVKPAPGVMDKKSPVEGQFLRGRIIHPNYLLSASRLETEGNFITDHDNTFHIGIAVAVAEYFAGVHIAKMQFIRQVIEELVNHP